MSREVRRPWTPDVTTESGGTRITAKRCCNGCGRTLGDVNDGEMAAAVNGQPLPDVTHECGCTGNEVPAQESALRKGSAEPTTADLWAEVVKLDRIIAVRTGERYRASAERNVALAKVAQVEAERDALLLRARPVVGSHIPIPRPDYTTLTNPTRDRDVSR